MLACYACAGRSKLPLKEVPRADFYGEHQNILLPLCTKHALEVANAGAEISPIPGTEDEGVQPT